MIQMKRYVYYSKQDKAKESVDSVIRATITEAVEYFAARKTLSVEKFLTIFTVDHDKNCS